jgi:dTDP-glucose 4,6-dehydratase
MSNKKRLLLTGIGGFCASHFCEHILKNTDWEIVGLESFRHKGDSLRIIKDPRITVYTCDCSAPISYRLEHQIGDVDFIVNMASDSHVERSITDPVDFVKNNFNLALYMLEFARRQKNLKKFIQISTDEVFGAALDGHNHTEWEHHLPSNPYSASKSCQEQLCISYWRCYGLPVIITNTMNIIGEKQDPEKFLPMLITKINKGEEVIIHGNDNYIGKRYYLHARNQADAILFILKNVDVVSYYDTIDRVIKPERFNIVGDVEMNNLELALMVAKIMDKKLKYTLVDFHKARAGHDRRYALDGTKIKERGWVAPVSFEDSLKKTIEWTLAHPEWLI